MTRLLGTIMAASYSTTLICPTFLRSSGCYLSAKRAEKILKPQVAARGMMLNYSSLMKNWRECCRLFSGPCF